jgi:hypothetical protein
VPVALLLGRITPALFLDGNGILTLLFFHDLFDFPTRVLMVVLFYSPKVQPRPTCLPGAFEG